MSELHPDYPGTIIHYERDWLYPVETADSVNYVAKIDYEADELPSNYAWADFEINDGSNTAHLSFEFSNEHEYTLSKLAIEKLRGALNRVEAAMDKAYETNEAAKAMGHDGNENT